MESNSIMVHPTIALLKNRAKKNRNKMSQQKGTLDTTPGTFRYNSTNGFTFEPNRGLNGKNNHYHSNVKLNNNKTQFSMKWAPWEEWGPWMTIHQTFPLRIVYTNMPRASTPERKRRRRRIPPHTP
jgi:hypothetical protein